MRLKLAESLSFSELQKILEQCERYSLPFVISSLPRNLSSEFFPSKCCNVNKTDKIKWNFENFVNLRFSTPKRFKVSSFWEQWNFETFETLSFNFSTMKENSSLCEERKCTEKNLVPGWKIQIRVWRNSRDKGTGIHERQNVDRGRRTKGRRPKREDASRRSFSCGEKRSYGRFCVMHGQRRSRLCTCHVLSPPYLSRNDKFASHCPVPGTACFSANRALKGAERRCWPIVRSGWLIVLSTTENFTEGKRDSELSPRDGHGTPNLFSEAVTYHLSGEIRLKRQLSVTNICVIRSIPAVGTEDL